MTGALLLQTSHLGRQVSAQRVLVQHSRDGVSVWDSRCPALGFTLVAELYRLPAAVATVAGALQVYHRVANTADFDYLIVDWSSGLSADWSGDASVTCASPVGGNCALLQAGKRLHLVPLTAPLASLAGPTSVRPHPHTVARCVATDLPDLESIRLAQPASPSDSPRLFAYCLTTRLSYIPKPIHY